MFRKTLVLFLASLFLVLPWGCNTQTEDPFFLEWKFSLGEVPGVLDTGFDDSGWQTVSIPHDWSIAQAYTTENTAASTGFLPGGIGWYRKSFVLSETEGKHIRIEFDGVYNNSKVWLNGKELGERPYGYSSFSYELNEHLAPAGEENILAVRVDRSAYADSRWYTGSGIYRDVRLVVTDEVHIPQWGVRITTPEISAGQAKVKMRIEVEAGSQEGEELSLEVAIVDSKGAEAASWEQKLILGQQEWVSADLELENPGLWSLENPELYTATVSIISEGKVLDRSVNRFGIRSIHFDADKGFFLNGEAVKIKGVNLHHDAGCVGAAVPADIWVSRVKKLKDMGCNAIRMAHNPHDPALMDICDELGMLVMAEAFDEWNVPKKKSVNWLSDNAASPEASRSYPLVFDQWAERDLKDLIRRDINHPSVIMWSIGNEIEWTFPYYPQASTYSIGNLDAEYFGTAPGYDADMIMKRLKEIHPGPDTLQIIAEKLGRWVRELDTTRYITSGSVHPSVGLASGYHAQLDASGFNYRASEYDAAHASYPELIIYGSENWVTWPEWKAVNERDFVAGIFVWTGFAYKGEAGPYPRMGLNISLFDFAGHKTPRGHLFETFWKEDSKVRMGCIPESDSEFKFSEKAGWVYTERTYEIPQMSWLRRWEWYDLLERWDYSTDERIIVMGYTNCQEAELFLNGESLGKQLLEETKDRLMKWLVPYREGELKIVGYNDGAIADSYVLQTAGKADRIELKADRSSMVANHRDVVMVEAQLLDKDGIPVMDQEVEIQFEMEGGAKIIGVDNGSEYNVQNARADRVETYQGRALLVVQSKGEAGGLSISASTPELESNKLSIKLQ